MGGTLTKVDLGYGRGWAAPAPAASIRRIDSQLGRLADINEAGRSPEQADENRRKWLAYERYLNGGTWAPKAAYALGSDKSVHCWGYAADSDDWYDERTAAVWHDNGWRQTARYFDSNGRPTAKDEPWHGEYSEHLDNHRHDPAPAGGATAPPISKEDDTMLMLRVHYNKGVHEVALGNKTFRHFIQSDPRAAIAKNAGVEFKDIQASDLDAYLRTYGCDLGIYRSATGETFEVLDPLTGKFGQGQVWTAENATRAEIRALKKTLTGTK